MRRLVRCSGSLRLAVLAPVRRATCTDRGPGSGHPRPRADMVAMAIRRAVRPASCRSPFRVVHHHGRDVEPRGAAPDQSPCHPGAWRAHRRREQSAPLRVIRGSKFRMPGAGSRAAGARSRGPRGGRSWRTLAVTPSPLRPHSVPTPSPLRPHSVPTPSPPRPHPVPTPSPPRPHCDETARSRISRIFESGSFLGCDAPRDGARQAVQGK